MEFLALDVNIPFFEFFVGPFVVVGKHLKIFHLGEGESTVLLRKMGNVADLLL